MSITLDPLQQLGYTEEILLLQRQGQICISICWTNEEQVQRIAAFKDDSCHGINIAGDYAAVYGGYSYGFLSLDQRTMTRLKCDDWIQHACCCRSGNDRIALLTANNVVCVHDKSGNRLQTIISNFESILYSGYLMSDDARGFEIYAGSVLGDIISWSSRSKATRRFSHDNGHNGPVFCITPFEFQGRALAATTSDDRSLRVWDTEHGTVLSVGWAHTARVWKVIYCADGMLVSAGEDGFVIAWRLGITDFRLTTVGIISEHRGKNAWAMAWHENGLLASSGADGVVRCTKVEQQFKQLDCIFGVTNVKTYLLLSLELVAVLHKSGELVIYDVASNERRRSLSRINAKSMNIVTWPSGEIVVSYDVHIICFFDDGSSSKRSLDSPIISMFALSQQYLLCCLANKQMTLLDLQTLMPKRYKDKLRSQIDSAAVDQRTLVIGYRNGWLGIFAISTHELNLLRTIESMHDDGIKGISLVDSGTMLRTLSRDGMLKKSRLHRDDVELLDETLLDKATMTDYVKLDNRYAYGLRGNELVAYNLDTCCEIDTRQRVPRGNKFQFIVSAEASIVASVPGGTLNITQSTHTDTYKSGRPLHGREIKAMAIARSIPLCATGGEDCVIVISEVRNNSVYPVRELRKHTTGILALHWSPCDRYLFSGGGQATFYVWSIAYHEHVVDAYCIALLDLKNVADQRIMSFDVHSNICAVIFSNSILKLFTLDGRNLVLVAEARYSTCCLTAVRIFTINGIDYIAVGATDGYLSIWPTTCHPRLHPLSLTRVHQNSIKDILYDSANRIIYSVGDDCTLAQSHIQPNLHLTPLVIGHHAAGIVGATFYKEDYSAIATVSTDQQLCLWDTQTPHDNLLKSTYTHIADPAGLILANTPSQLVVFGIGIETLEFRS